MLTVDEARDLVRGHATPLEGVEAVWTGDASGRVLAVGVASDRDDPPFDRAAMDGLAVRSRDVPGVLRVTGEVSAGDAELPRVGPGEAVRINTGAPLPPGADAVVPVEDTDGGTVRRAVEPGANVVPRGAFARAGEIAVPPGPLTPERIAACAAAGADGIAVRRRPSVALLATGSELRDEPGVHEIRNSNGPLLRALTGGDDLGTAADDEASLDARLREGLSRDVLVTTGGVSRGGKDLVRARLEAAGVRVVFHGVAVQPGKPVLFGVHAGGAVFGLPGNPVSALVCADLFVLPYLAARSGGSFDEALVTTRAVTTAPVPAQERRQRYVPCVLRGGRAEPLPWRGSGDLFTVARGNAYVVVEPGRPLAAGDEVRCAVPRRHAAATLA